MTQQESGRIVNWADILTDIAEVHNWVDITPEKLDEFFNYVGVGQVTSSHDGLSREEVIDLLVEVDNANKKVPDSIVIHEDHEFETPGQLLDSIDDAGSGIVSDLKNFLGIDFKENTV